jgi:MFS family permease
MKIDNIYTFRAFNSTNYTLYFTGRAVSQFGSWMQRTAVIWVVYTLTHSPFMIGLTLFAEHFPSFLFSIFGGIIADRYNRYKIVKLTQIASMIQASLLALLIISGYNSVWAIQVLSVILGVINAFDIPARQTMIHDVVDKEEYLQSALSLNSAMANIAKLLGPALSGIILEEFGAGICFLVNAASFGGVILSLAFMKLPPPVIKRGKQRIFAEMADGFRYLGKTPSIGLIILMAGLVSLLVLPYETLIPVFAKVVFKGNAATFGYITSFIGAGAVGGTILLASLKQGVSLRKVLLISTVILSVGLICFALAGNFYIAMACAILMGFGGVAQFTTSNIIVQAESDPDMRGRSISILLTAMFGMLPFGSLVVGMLTNTIGAAGILIIEGMLGILIAGVFVIILKNIRH